MRIKEVRKMAYCMLGIALDGGDVLLSFNFAVVSFTVFPFPQSKSK
jgi:hypothetical protein